MFLFFSATRAAGSWQIRSSCVQRSEGGEKKALNGRINAFCLYGVRQLKARGK